MGYTGEEQDWHPLTLPITGDEAEQVIASAGAVIIHVWAVWNHYDRRMDEIIQILRSDFENEVRFYALDVDPEPHWAFNLRHQVMNVPTLICYVNGRHMETITGLRSQEELRSMIQQMIESKIE